MSTATDHAQSRPPDYARAKAKAREVLLENSVISPPIDVFKIALNYVTEVLIGDFEEYDFLAGYLEWEKGIIVVNNDHSITRQRFTVAHELGHYLLHREEMAGSQKYSKVYRVPVGGESEPAEQEANAFAAELLVPLQWLKFYRYEELMTPRQLADFFMVSEEVIGYRLKSVR